MNRPDETWHRLQNWTAGSGLSERLAAQVLFAARFTDIDPIHPLGGRDGRKDARCVKDGQPWIMAVYFPLGQQSFADIRKKFRADLDGVAKNGARGIAFVTNQKLSDGERAELRDLCDSALLELQGELVLPRPLRQKSSTYIIQWTAAPRSCIKCGWKPILNNYVSAPSPKTRSPATGS